MEPAGGGGPQHDREEKRPVRAAPGMRKQQETPNTAPRRGRRGAGKTGCTARHAAGSRRAAAPAPRAGGRRLRTEPEPDAVGRARRQHAGAADAKAALIRGEGHDPHDRADGRAACDKAWHGTRSERAVGRQGT